MKIDLSPPHGALIEIDRRKYRNYSSTLGSYAGKSLDEFQKTKFNHLEKFAFVKLEYHLKKDLAEHPEKALPGTDHLILADAKFTRYLFGGTNEHG